MTKEMLYAVKKYDILDIFKSENTGFKEEN